jgi:hypothetical protein
MLFNKASGYQRTKKPQLSLLSPEIPIAANLTWQSMAGSAPETLRRHGHSVLHPLGQRFWCTRARRYSSRASSPIAPGVPAYPVQPRSMRTPTSTFVQSASASSVVNSSMTKVVAWPMCMRPNNHLHDLLTIGLPVDCVASPTLSPGLLAGIRKSLPARTGCGVHSKKESLF